MKKLLEFLLEKITQKKDFVIKEEAEGDRVDYQISLPQETIGLVIGKEGKTVRAIRSLLKVRAALEKKAVNLSLNS